MVNNIEINYIRHIDLKIKDKNEINILKSQHWNYSLEEHDLWMNSNIKDSDYHILIKSNQMIIGYMNVVNRILMIDNKNIEALGIGNVCVDKNYIGKKIGLLLMDACNIFLKYNSKIGILLCKDNLIKFYLKSGWNLYDGNLLIEDSIPSEINLFINNQIYINKSYLKINKSF